MAVPRRLEGRRRVPRRHRDARRRVRGARGPAYAPREPRRVLPRRPDDRLHAARGDLPRRPTRSCWCRACCTRRSTSTSPTRCCATCSTTTSSPPTSTSRPAPRSPSSRGASPTLFVVVQVVWPDSFINAEGFDRSWFELLYLSFSTLTSVGLSDIVAVGAAGPLGRDGRDDGRRVLHRDGRGSRMVGLTMMRHRR